MSSNLAQTNYAQQLIHKLEKDKTFNIELKEASNTFLEKGMET